MEVADCKWFTSALKTVVRRALALHTVTELHVAPVRRTQVSKEIMSRAGTVNHAQTSVTPNESEGPCCLRSWK